MLDLVILVADKSIQFGMQGALTRYQALGTRQFDFDFIVHSERDAGARLTGPDLLVLERRRCAHALLVFDWEGCGSDQPNSVSLESELDARLAHHWGDHGKAIVVSPEADTWLWGSDQALAQALEWPAAVSVRTWLGQQGFEIARDGKPVRPKEAF
jgi:hypothetical protein